MTPEAIETHRLYKFEELTQAISPYANRRRTLPFLKSIAQDVWAKHGRARLDVPIIRIGKGTPCGGSTASYADGYGLIELTRPQATVGVLLHELTHSMGFGRPHGKGFVRKYFDLLVEYGRCEKGKLILDASLFKLKGF